MKLHYIQRKSHVSSILWLIGCGLGMTHFPVKKVYAGLDLGNTVWINRKSEGFLCGDKSTHLDRLVVNFQKYVRAHRVHAGQIKQIFVRRAHAFDKFIQRMAVQDYRALSNAKLWADYQKLTWGYTHVYPYGEPFAIALGDFSEMLKAEFKLKGVSEDEFDTLLLPAETSFLQRERLDFLKIVLQGKRGNISFKIRRLLDAHQVKYLWLPYDYGVTFYNKEHFYKAYSALKKKSGRKLVEEYQGLADYTRYTKKRQGDIIRKYQLSKQDVSLVEVVRTAIFLVDYKKEIFTKCHWYAERIFDEISRRLKLTKQLVRYMLPNEVREVLLGQCRVSEDLIKARYAYCVILIKKTGGYKLLDAAQSKVTVKNFLNQYQKKRISKKFEGRVGNGGIASGRVRVLMNAKGVENFRHGEVLVAPMTSPDYVLAIRKAAAIITDEGGAMCHAAILARELGIPCVVGTKLATRVLHTGDLVEVNAKHGVVTLLKSLRKL